MTQMEQVTLKKAEFNNLIRTVVSTITILCGIFIGGLKMKDAIVSDIRAEFRAEIKSQLDNFEARQQLRDREQDYRLQDLRNDVVRFHKDL